MDNKTLNIGPCPASEIAAQLGDPNYYRLARFESRLYMEQLREEVAIKWPDFGCLIYFRMNSNPHDHGTYHEVEAVYDPDNEIAVSQAFYCEGEASDVWTPENAAKLLSYKKSIGVSCES